MAKQSTFLTLLFFNLFHVSALWRPEHPFYVEWDHHAHAMVTHKNLTNLISPSALCYSQGFYTRTTSDDTSPPPSQVGQDLAVFSYLGNKTGGFFVDLAANHYYTLSNTFFLEQHLGWQGICIEPNPVYRAALLTERRCALVTSPVSSLSNLLVKFRYSGGAVGGIVGEDNDNQPIAGVVDSEVYTISLTAVLLYLNAPPGWFLLATVKSL